MNKSLFNLSIKTRSFPNGWFEPGKPVSLCAADTEYSTKPFLSFGFPGNSGVSDKRGITEIGRTQGKTKSRWN